MCQDLRAESIALALTLLREKLVLISGQCLLLQGSVWCWICEFLSSFHINFGESEHAASASKGRLPVI